MIIISSELKSPFAHHIIPKRSVCSKAKYCINAAICSMSQTGSLKSFLTAKAPVLCQCSPVSDSVINPAPVPQAGEPRGVWPMIDEDYTTPALLPATATTVHQHSTQHRAESSLTIETSEKLAKEINTKHPPTTTPLPSYSIQEKDPTFEFHLK